MHFMNLHPVLLALLSAALFGVSTPAAKALLGVLDPAVLAGLLYCGGGPRIALFRRAGRGLLSGTIGSEAPLTAKDVPWLAGAIVAGGITGPLLLMFGLARTDATTASLLLMLEGVATALLAWFVFRENFDRRIALGMAALVAGAFGQVAPVSPYFAVVSGDEAMMRCGSDDNFYPIAKLVRGQLVRVDGEGGGWSRVGYPAGTPAFIPADSFQPDASGKSGTVTKASKLKALNMTTGLKGSWAPVLENPAPTGTKLVILDAEATPDGRGSTAFKVTPPENARAFVQSNALRRATNEEINAATDAFDLLDLTSGIRCSPDGPADLTVIVRQLMLTAEPVD